MRTLIDGYNLMHAKGLLGRRFGPDGFRQVRHRFLNDLADALGPASSPLTTVVFDASKPPEDRPGRAQHKGIVVLFAVEDGEADSLIERLIAADSAPRSLTVVSSDHRVRKAAERRKARALTSEAFLDHLDGLRKSARKRRAAENANPAAARPEKPRPEPSPSEAESWVREFAALGDAEEFRELAGRRPDDPFPDDDDLRRIAREVAAEPALGHGLGRIPRPHSGR